MSMIINVLSRATSSELTWNIYNHHHYHLLVLMWILFHTNFKLWWSPSTPALNWYTVCFLPFMYLRGIKEIPLLKKCYCYESCNNVISIIELSLKKHISKQLQKMLLKNDCHRLSFILLPDLAMVSGVEVVWGFLFLLILLHQT
jgi:hypothetical protein